MTIDISVLQAEIQNDPANIGYAAMLPASPGSVVDAMNSPTQTDYKSRMISERGIMDHYPDGSIAADILLSKLEGFTQSAHPAAGSVKRAMKFLAMPDGIDIGSKAMHNMLDMLASGGVITVDEATKLKALSYTKCSRAYILFGDVSVTEADLRMAGVV